MATGEDLRKLALGLPGTVEYPHFDRVAFKVARTYVTLSADGRSANLRLTPDEQAFKCLLAPAAFTPLDNAWGRQGWTRVDLAALDGAELAAALESAWTGAHPKPKQPKPNRPRTTGLRVTPRKSSRPR